jgi:hypothetical protein
MRYATIRYSWPHVCGGRRLRFENIRHSSTAYFGLCALWRISGGVEPGDKSKTGLRHFITLTSLFFWMKVRPSEHGQWHR